MDEECLNKVRQEFIPRAKAFNPDLILHNFGHDTCGGDYGDLGLTQDFSPNWPWNSAIEPGRSVGGRYLVPTHGGHRVDVADSIFPALLKILAAAA